MHAFSWYFMGRIISKILLMFNDDLGMFFEE